MELQEKNVPLKRPIRPEGDLISRYDWNQIDTAISTNGAAVLEKLLTAKECQLIAGLYSEEEHFRSHIIMARHGFGKGEYRYFKYPLPKLIVGLRTTLYSRLAPIAVHHRPVEGTRGTYRVNLRHGVSRVRSGRRHTVGIIFHDGT
jgi:uncharacterized protein